METIIINIENPADLSQLESLPENAAALELTRMGFNTVIPPEGTQSRIELQNQSRDVLESAQSLDELLAPDQISSEALWNPLTDSDHVAIPLRFRGMHAEREQAALMLQMSIPRLPIYDLDQRLIPGTPPYNQRDGREFRELLRSLMFWRTKFGIGSSQPRLVHTDDSGLLIFIISSWLIVLNFTDEDVSVDVGTGGAMWLMLATGHDVHLHGSLLDLPSNSGAILANELAR